MKTAADRLVGSSPSPSATTLFYLGEVAELAEGGTLLRCCTD